MTSLHPLKAHGCSLAENAHKPLYHVTCGEIGFSPQAVERHLSKVMQQAERWNASMQNLCNTY